MVESEIVDHLQRHAVEPGVVELARPTVHRALAETEFGPAWVTLDWSRRRSVLRIRPVPHGRLVGEAIGSGATRAHREATALTAAQRSGAAANAGDQVVELDVARALQRDIDLGPLPPELLERDSAAQLIGLISHEAAHGRSLEEAAARAGASMAAVVADSMDGAGRDAGAAARAMVAVEERLGADFEVVEADGRRAVIRAGRCPFGPATRPAMCRFTSALAGGLAARGAGQADVTVLESQAAGDHECRLIVDTASESDASIAHHYDWPPPPPDDRDDADTASEDRSFHVTLSLQLPRDRLSVPVTRHLVRAAMDEVGVVTDDADAVDLAVTEACGNVIDHSGPGDAYEVSVAISPRACHIRVVDVGRGFDHHALSLSGMPDHEAEHGRGVALMQALVDQVRFESEPEKGTVVHLVKRLEFVESAVAHRLMDKAD